MTDLAIADLRSDLLDAKAILVPQLRGLDALANDKLSGDAIEAINAQRRWRNARLDLVNQVLMLLDALDDNGYPDLPAVVIPTEIQVELQKEKADLESAFGIFVASPERGDFNPDSATKTEGSRT